MPSDPIYLVSIKSEATSVRSCAGKWFLLLLLGAILWLAFLTEPRAAAGDGRDGSWMEAYAQFLKHGAQAGRDYVFTYGPLGHFAVQGFDPKLYWKSYGFEIIFKAVLAAIYLAYAMRLSTAGLAVLFCAITALPLLLLGQPVDGVLILALLLEFAQLAREEEPPNWRFVAFAFLAATFGLMKFTILVLGAVGIVLLTVGLILRKRVRLAWAPAAAFGVFFLGWWILLGQRLANIPAFLQMSSEVAFGYTEAMGREGDRDDLLLGVSVLASLIAAMAPHCWKEARSVLTRSSTPLFLLVVVAVLLSWKHAFIRADHGHTVGFFWIVTPLLFVLPRAFCCHDWRTPARCALLGACAGLSLFGFASIARRFDGVSLITGIPKHTRAIGICVSTGFSIRTA